MATVIASSVVDSCLVKNGGCDANSNCSHESPSNAVICTCKTGYTNTGSAANVTCTGELLLTEAHDVCHANVVDIVCSQTAAK